jgi:Tol biopolymer transport system component
MGSIKIWDTETGRDIQTPWICNGSVAYSPDGNSIVSSLGNAIVIWDVETEQEKQSFSKYSYTGSAVYSTDGKFINSSSNGVFKVWDVEMGQEVRNLPLERGGSALAYSPDGRSIVFHTEGRIKIWNIETGRKLLTFSEHSHDVTSVAYSPDGKFIVSGSDGSMTFNPDGETIYSYTDTIKIWDAKTGRELQTLSGHSGNVNSVAYSPDGKFIVSGSGGSMTFNPDGETIYSYTDTIKIWDAKTGRELQNLSGHSRDVTSVAYSPDEKFIASSSWDNTIKIWDVETGHELRTLEGHTGGVNSVEFSPDGRRILSCSGDGTTRLWDAATGAELASFISFTDNEWIVITPEGFYNASPNGDKYLNVRVGNQVYGIDQFRMLFYRPDVVELALAGEREAYLEKIGEMDIRNAALFLPPVVEFSGISDGDEVKAESLSLTIKVSDANHPVNEVRVQVNGRTARLDRIAEAGSAGAVGGGAADAAGAAQSRGASLERTYQVALDPDWNDIEVFANNGYSYGSRLIGVNAQPEWTADSGRDTVPNLYVLSIGINTYNDPSLKSLDYAVNDAREILGAFKAQEGKLFGKVHTRLIADGASLVPTKKTILDNLDFFAPAGERDMVLLFVAGHGLTLSGEGFFFLPADADLSGTEAVKRTAVSGAALNKALEVPGRKLALIDACHSADVRADGNRLVRSLSDSAMVFASSSGSELSYENAEYRHGFFTWGLLEGLGGAAEAGETRDGYISMRELYGFVREAVQELSGGAQNPYLTSYTDFRVSKWE